MSTIVMEDEDKSDVMEIPNVNLLTEDEEELRTHVLQKVFNMVDYHGVRFPACQPVTLDIRNIGLLSLHHYLVSWQADSTRFLMLIEDRDKIYLVDQRTFVYKVGKMTFPSKLDSTKHLTETLVDGEMVWDSYENKVVPRYLINDIIMFCQQQVGKSEFPIRLQCIETEIVNERARAMKDGEIDRASEPFGVRLKPFYTLDKTEEILGTLKNSLLHQSLGAIFQPVKQPYVPSRSDFVLKWSPPQLNGINFRLEITNGDDPLTCPRVGQLYVEWLPHPFCQLGKVTDNVAEFDGKIIECQWLETDGWIFLRGKMDRCVPDDVSIAHSTDTKYITTFHFSKILHVHQLPIQETMKRPLTKDYLLYFIQNHQHRDQNLTLKL